MHPADVLAPSSIRRVAVALRSLSLFVPAAGESSSSTAFLRFYSTRLLLVRPVWLLCTPCRKYGMFGMSQSCSDASIQPTAGEVRRIGDAPGEWNQPRSPGLAMHWPITGIPLRSLSLLLPLHPRRLIAWSIGVGRTRRNLPANPSALSFPAGACPCQLPTQQLGALDNGER